MPEPHALPTFEMVQPGLHPDNFSINGAHAMEFRSHKSFGVGLSGIDFTIVQKLIQH